MKWRIGMFVGFLLAALWIGIGLVGIQQCNWNPVESSVVRPGFFCQGPSQLIFYGPILLFFYAAAAVFFFDAHSLGAYGLTAIILLEVVLLLVLGYLITRTLSRLRKR